jgi:hypothetical protein
VGAGRASRGRREFALWPGDRMYAAVKIVKNDFFIGMVSINETFPIS